MRFSRKLFLASSIAFGMLSATAQAQGTGWQEKVDPWVLASAAQAETEFLVFLAEQADLAGASKLKTKLEKGRYVSERLREVANRTQGPLLSSLVAQGVPHQAYWVANMVWVRGNRSVVQAVASRSDVAHIYANPAVAFEGPVEGGASDAKSTPDAIEWNILKVRAPEVWAAGFTGQGIVLAGGDTGYDWDHPALLNKYRGWNGSSADHNYNWHDAIHSGGGICGPDSPEPCDDNNHGTHTMGTMVGDDGGNNQIGMAPGAKWIGCRNMDRGNGTPATYSECFQWFIAPTDLNGQNPDPSKAPHVVNNSWACPASEGCTDPNVLKTIVENTRAAGIVVVVSAGNSGPGCSSVNDPPAIYDASFSVGATNNSDIIASFSSRGPVIVDSSNRLKPDVSAPGVGVRSSIRGVGYSSFSGTSMAGPHVAGLVGLLLSAYPSMAGQIDSIETLIQQTAVPRTTTQECGGVPGSQIPNNTYGYGRADAFAAVQAQSADLSIAKSASPNPVLAGQPLTYTVLATNQGPAAATGVTLTDPLPPGVTLNSIIPSQGTCLFASGTVTCSLGGLAASAAATVQIVVTPQAAGTLTNMASVFGNQIDLVSTNNSIQVQSVVAACPPPAPAITAPLSVAPTTGGYLASVPGTAGHTYNWTISGGTITAGQGSSQITFTSAAAGTTMLLQVIASVQGCDSPPGTRAVQVDFLDVPPSHPFHDFVVAVARNGITAGCGGGNYCPDASVSREQMAAFIIRAVGEFNPPTPPMQRFLDVPSTNPFYAFIDRMAVLGITQGCSANPPLYCPDASVTRGQMAVFLLRARFGSGYMPPAPTGIFGDVPPSDPFAAWIEDLFNRGITSGCSVSPLLYCPNNPNTRGAMAVFLARSFNLP